MHNSLMIADAAGGPIVLAAFGFAVLGLALIIGLVILAVVLIKKAVKKKKERSDGK